MKKKISSVVTFVAVLLLSLSVLGAQELELGPKTDKKPDKKLFFYGANSKKKQPAKVEKSPVLPAKISKSPVQPPVKKVEKKKKMTQEEIDATISRNEDATIKKYKDILESEKYEVKNLRARVKTNEKLVSQYSKELSVAEKQLEQVKVELTTRAILLKKSRDDGQISQEKFNKEFKKINNRLKMESTELSADVEFYSREVARAKSRLSRLKDELQIKEEARKVAEKYGKKLGKGKFSNGEFQKIYRSFKAMLPKKLKPVFVNNPFKTPILLKK